MIPVMQNAIPPREEAGVAARVARQTLEKRGPDYTHEVRRLLDAALETMGQCGTDSRPRVADIVAAAGLSNEAFYRHFASKDELVAAVLEDGAQRLAGYLEHQMDKAATPEAKVRRWVEGVLSQADEAIAATTLAVLWNGGAVSRGGASGRHFATEPIAALLREPLAALGSAHPELDATLAAHATLGRLEDHLWQRTTPTRAEIDAITAFFLATTHGPSR
jgi:AcrR family transcriptional regulator